MQYSITIKSLVRLFIGDNIWLRVVLDVKTAIQVAVTANLELRMYN